MYIYTKNRSAKLPSYDLFRESAKLPSYDLVREKQWQDSIISATRPSQYALVGHMSGDISTSHAQNASKHKRQQKLPLWQNLPLTAVAIISATAPSQEAPTLLLSPLPSRRRSECANHGRASPGGVPPIGPATCRYPDELPVGSPPMSWGLTLCMLL